jgi:hypothetical protein
MRGLVVSLTIVCASVPALAGHANVPAPGSGSGVSSADPEATPEGEANPPRSQFTLAFAGGALVPQGAMGAQTDPGLDVWGRLGWLTPSGLGLVMNVEFAPLRRTPGTTTGDEVVDSQLFAATAGPRFTLGRDVVRVWIAGGAGVVVERTAVTAADLSSEVDVEGVFGVSGGGGLDLCFFGAGGITLAGAYTRGVSGGAETEYVSVNAGLVFVY